jgi:GYF domain 2
MVDRSWYYAAQGQQQGPFSEDQLRGFIARGVVTGETLVWSQGMAAWEKAGQVPGLTSTVGGDAAASPPVLGDTPSYEMSPYDAAPGGAPAALSAKFDLWAYLGWATLFVVGEFLVVLMPWTAVYFYRYVTERIRVPGRPNLSFTGQPLDIWYVFMGIGVLAYAGLADNSFLQLAGFVGQAFLGWMVLRWVISKLASNGEPLPIRFEGNAVVYFGWYLFMVVAAISIIGWAWVLTAWMRWICRNIHGTRREVIFTASGLQVLWRTFVFSFGCAFIIPIPWVVRWYTQWYVSQFALVPRTAA